MIESGCSSRFASKPLERLWLPREFFREEFEGDRAVKAAIVSLIDDTHPARTKLLQDAVMRNGLADHWQVASWKRPPSAYRVGSSGLASGSVFLLSAAGGLGDPSTLKSFAPSPKVFVASR